MIPGVTLDQVGKWIERRMAARKWSVKVIQKRSGLARTTIYDLLNGKHPPTTDTQNAMAVALECEVGWFDVLMAGGEPADEVPTDRSLDEKVDLILGGVERLERLVESLVTRWEIEDLPNDERGTQAR